MMPAVQEALSGSVQSFPNAGQGGIGDVVIRLGVLADDMPAYGGAGRDAWLRSFWKTEPWLASAIGAIASRNASFHRKIIGEEATALAVTEMLEVCDFGNGWETMMLKFNVDLLTQDNGGFLEPIRADATAGPLSPVISVAHLDSGACTRTGDPTEPVWYTDRKSKKTHKLKPWQVVAVSDMPSPNQDDNGRGVCAVSRMLETARYLRDIEIYRREKASGRFTKEIHIVSGVSTKAVEDALVSANTRADDRALVRYMAPVIMGTVKPGEKIDHAVIALASLGDGFDEEKVQKWYIALLALALGADYQDLAPLPGGNLGTSTQSQVMDQKSKGKGPALFQALTAHAFNTKILPSNVRLEFDEDDPAEQQQTATIRKTRADARKVDIDSGVYTVAIARQRAMDDGDLTQEQIDAMEAEEAEHAAEDERRQAEAAAQLQNQPPAAEGDQPSAGEPGTDTTVAQGAETPVNGRRPATVTKAKKSAPTMRHDDWQATQAPLEKAVRGALADMGSDVLGIVQKFKAIPVLEVKSTPADLESPEFWRAQEAKFKAATGPAVRATIRNAAARPVGGLVPDLDLVNERVLALTRQYQDAWWQQLETTTRNGLRTAIVDWQESGLGTKGLPDLVTELQHWFSPDRAERIATTEVTRLFATGRLASMADNPLVTEWDWTTGEDELVCPICDAYAADGPYKVGAGPAFPAHPNCRCEPVEVIARPAIIAGQAAA